MERLTRKTINFPASRPFTSLLIVGLLLVTSLIFSSYQVLSSSSQSVYNKEHKTSVPFHAKLQTSIQIIGQQVRSQGTGTATHLGKTTFECKQLSTLLFNQPRSTAPQLSLLQTAINSILLSAALQGPMVLEPLLEIFIMK